MAESLERPSSLARLRPKSARFNTNVSTFLKKRKSSRITHREVVIPHLEKSASERLIYERCEAALNGSYEERAEFLNSLHQMIMETLPESLNSPEFFELICLKILLFLKDDYPAIRAMSFRILRLCLFTERNLTFMVNNHVDIYVVRSLDLCVDNEMERCESLRLIGAMITVYQTSFLKKLIEDSVAQNNGKKYAFPKSIMQPVIAIALKTINKPPGAPDSGGCGTDGPDKEEDDRLGLACVAMFLEFCIHEPRLMIDMSGTDWIVRVLTGNSGVNKGIANLVCRVLVNWLDDPAVRNMAQLHLVLEQIFAPLIEFGFFERSYTSSEKVDKMIEGVMITFSHSFLSILRSWSGLFACAAVGPTATVIASSPLRLLEYLGLGTVGNVNLSHIRDMIVNICCDFMDAPYAQKNFQNWKEAVDFYGSLSTPDIFSSSLKEDFVLAQNDIILGQDQEFIRYVDVLASFRYLAFFVLINAGLPQSLARLIIANPNAPSAIKATLLLADFLRVAPSIIPSTWRATVLSLPSLFQSASEAVIGSKSAAAVHGLYDYDGPETFSYINAENATIALHRFDQLNQVWIHNMSAEPPYDSNYSLFMDHRPLTPLLSERKPWRTDESFSNLVSNCWKNDALNIQNCIFMFIEALRDLSICQRTDCLNDVLEIIFKVLQEVSPARGPQLAWAEDRQLVVAAKRAIHLALRYPSKQQEVEEILIRFIREFKEKISTDLYNIKHLVYSGSMYHLSLVGTYSSHRLGAQILQKEAIFQIYIEKMNNTTPPELVKAVIASLDYSDNGGQPSLTRLVLHKALTSTNEPARRWCTRFLGAIAGQRLPDFYDWGIRLLLGQLGDESVKVVRQTIRMLHQWLPMYPQSVKNLRAVPLNAFGEAGLLLKAYLYADEDICLSNHDTLMEAIHTWMTGFNTRYFESLDEDMRVCLLNVKRSITGGFSRISHERLRFGVRAPAHLFGSLAKHHYGRELLKSERVIRQLLVQLGEEKDMALVKGAVIALGQIGSTAGGVELFSPDVIPKMIRLAEESPTLSARGAAFWALNMVATSEIGSKLLCEYGWESNQHKWVVDEIRKKYEGDEDEERRPTTSAQIVPEVSISFDKATAQQKRGLESPAGRKTGRARSSSESCWAPAKLILEHGPRLRRSGSDSGFEYPTIDSPLIFEYDSDNVRSRAMTSESGITSGLSSSWIDESIGNRRRATTTTSQCEDPANESRSRSSTVARCLSQGLTVEKSRLEAEGTVADLLRDPHFSTKYREKWRLAPFKTRRFLQVNRNIGDPVRYIFMTKGEEECVAAYRFHLMGDSWLQRHLQATALSGKSQVMQPVYIAALPSEVQVMCGNIFHPKKLFSDENDRGAKSGHSKNQRTDPALAHSSYRCFYCASNAEKYPLPAQVDVAALRRQVLNEVDMLEIKESPEKKLINLRAAHPWLFEWPCLYADVLELLDEYRFKPRSRSFLQEIFYDALKL